MVRPIFKSFPVSQIFKYDNRGKMKGVRSLRHVTQRNNDYKANSAVTPLLLWPDPGIQLGYGS